MNENKRIGEPILKVQDLHVSYGKIAAIKGVSFEVHKGEVVAMLGANGAGKTTTLNALTGVLPVKSGTIEFHGKSLVNVPTNRITAMGVVHVPEGRHIFPDLTVEENLRVAAYLYETKNKTQFLERKEQVFELFPRLKERIHQSGGTLSGGEQQMLAIGRALVTGGELLLLDEPSMGIAPKLVAEIFHTITQIAKNGQTIMLVEQNAVMAMEIAHYCYVLETGCVTYEGSSEYIQANERIAQAYLG